jgi:hypothetical protein
MTKAIQPYFSLPFSPEDAVNAVFTEVRGDDLISELNTWLPVALANRIGQYEEPEDRECLIAFLDDFKELIEVITAPHFKNKKDFSIVRTEFMTKYSIGYVRQELFDLLVSVATYEGILEVSKGFAGTFFLYFITIAEATFLLNKER